MRNYLIPIIVIAGILAGYFFFTEKEKEAPDYRERIEKHRSELNYFMRADQGSPFADIPGPERDLAFFPVNEKWKVSARFEAVQDIRKVELATSDGQSREYFRYGYLVFELEGQPQRLLVYRSAEPGSSELFLGFMDPTNGETTYGGGRYLDINHSGQNTILLDFNLAYNPYCAYNPEFVCPFPPRENMLTVPVQAGEKNYPGKKSVELN